MHGIGRSTGAANQIATDVANKDTELYKTALEEYNTNRQQAYTEWSGSITAAQNRLTALSNATNTKISNLGTLATNYTTSKQNEASDLTALEEEQANETANLALAAV